MVSIWRCDYKVLVCISINFKSHKEQTVEFSQNLRGNLRVVHTNQVIIDLFHSIMFSGFLILISHESLFAVQRYQCDFPNHIFRHDELSLVQKKGHFDLLSIRGKTTDTWCLKKARMVGSHIASVWTAKFVSDPTGLHK